VPAKISGIMVTQTVIRITAIPQETVSLHHTTSGKRYVQHENKTHNGNPDRNNTRRRDRRPDNPQPPGLRTPAAGQPARTHPAIAELPRRAVPQPGSKPDDDGRQKPPERHPRIPVPKKGGAAPRRGRPGPQDRPARTGSGQQPAGVVRALLLPAPGRRAACARRPRIPGRRTVLLPQQAFQGHRHLPSRRHARRGFARHHA